MRIIAGSAKGRPLKGPKGPGLRPTSDRVRESLFNILGQWLEGLVVLDLFAGTGALAFESLSRGASRAVLVDKGKEALRLCRENAAALGMLERSEILSSAVDSRLAPTLTSRGPFDLVFADPPYADFAPAQILELLAAVPLVRPEGRVVVEHDRRAEAPAALGPFERVDERRFGDTVVSFYRCRPDP